MYGMTIYAYLKAVFSGTGCEASDLSYRLKWALSEKNVADLFTFCKQVIFVIPSLPVKILFCTQLNLE